MENEPLYSTDKLFTLSKGNEVFVKKMILLFIETIPENIQKLKEAYEKGDFQTVKYVAHTMKPNLEMFEIKCLTATVKFVEHNAVSGDNQNLVKEGIEEIMNTLEIVMEDMKKRC